MERGAPASNGDRQTNSGGIWRLAWRGLRVSRSMAIILLLVASLAANAALFVGGVIYNVIDEALESATGLATETGKQRKEADDLKRKNRKLKDRMARLRKVTSDSVKRTVDRSAKAAVRAVATAPGKALPYVGTAVVVGATAWEIDDYCNTIRDMKAIQQEIDPSESFSKEEQRVCGMKVPTRDEILNRIKTAPRYAWQRSRELLTDLKIPPDLENWFNQKLKDTENLWRDGRGWLDRKWLNLTK